jgi:hypothetical protein
VLQALLAAELILLSMATIPLYPERGVLKHLFDLLKLGAGLAFVLFFIVISFGVASVGEQGNPLDISLQGFRDTPPSAYAWALAYTVVQLALSAWQAHQSADPRGTWARNNLGQGAATFISMFLMVFVAFFFARPVVAAFARMGLVMNVNALLASLMVIVRYVLALVLSTIPATEMDAIARNPYVDSPR